MGQHAGRELVQNSWGHAVIDCRECGFAHLWPKPTAEELGDYYNKSFYETHSPTDWAEKEEREQPYWEIEYSDRLSTFSDPWWVVHPVHVNYFNFDSLERVLRRCGFEPRARDATFPMEWFLLQGVDYIGRDDVGRKCHQQRMALERNLETAGLSQVRRGFNRWLASQGIGREAVVYAVKP